jgi:hypothetical protein
MDADVRTPARGAIIDALGRMLVARVKDVGAHV